MSCAASSRSSPDEGHHRRLTRPLVAEIARRIARETQATTTRHEIEVHAPASLVAAIDPIRIEQVLRNLLDNAVKFSPGGNVAVDVSTEDGVTVQLSVRDHGPALRRSGPSLWPRLHGSRTLVGLLEEGAQRTSEGPVRGM